MAKNFGGAANNARVFGDVAKTSAQKATVTTVKMIPNESLLDYPQNGEDLSYTRDLENSIAELGFTDPIEVTAFGAPDGCYIIVSGHRRRAAGVKLGMALFPCIVRAFASEAETRNYILLANSHRDTAKDPLLFCTRYKLHEKYLMDSGFEGSIREEIAKRLGVSVQQADRYNQMHSVIPQIWALVREGACGMSAVLPLAAFGEDEQLEMFATLKHYAEQGSSLTRAAVKGIIDCYRTDKEMKVAAAAQRNEPPSDDGEASGLDEPPSDDGEADELDEPPSGGKAWDKREPAPEPEPGAELEPEDNSSGKTTTGGNRCPFCGCRLDQPVDKRLR
jgi:hypothetical protein